MLHEHTQATCTLRCEWGRAGLEAIGGNVAAVVIVDVLSFSTAVDVAVSRGAEVLPCRWRDATAEDFARQKGAQLAQARGTPGALSLSPASLMGIEPGTRLVLPSPNGSTLSLLPRDATVFAGCFRNSRAVAEAVNRIGGPVAVIPAGERWSDGTLRPALEDLLGAGAILHGLAGEASPEARVAIAAYTAMVDELDHALLHSASGRELVESGYVEDVRLATELNVSTTVPRLHGSTYINTADTMYD